MSPGNGVPGAADVVIVGGGIMGTSTAYFLATETDLEVVLVEKDNIASGSTGDSSAIIRHHYGPDRVYSEMAAWSHEFYRSFEDRTGEDIAYASAPVVRFAQENTSNSEYAMAGCEVLSSLGIPVTKYSASEVAERFPMLKLTETDLAVSDDTSAYSDGTDVAGGFARAAQDRGATVVTSTAVTDVSVDDGTITGVETEDGSVDADSVVITAGPWTPRVTETVDVDVPIVTSREQIVLLKPPAEFQDRHLDELPASSPPNTDWYMRPDFGDGILVATHQTGEEVNPDAYKDVPDQEMLLYLIDEIEDFAPALADSKVRGQYCGVYSTTPDTDFVIDQVGPAGCYLGCGFSGHGFKHGPAVGKILSDLVTRGETDLVDIDPFSLARFEAD